MLLKRQSSVSLFEILEVSGEPLEEKYILALVEACCVYLLDAIRTESDTCLILNPTSLFITSDGFVQIDEESPVDARLLPPELQLLSSEDEIAFSEENYVCMLGLTIYDACDFGLDENEPLRISESLDFLLTSMINENPRRRQTLTAVREVVANLLNSYSAFPASFYLRHLNEMILGDDRFQNEKSNENAAPQEETQHQQSLRTLDDGDGGPSRPQSAPARPSSALAVLTPLKYGAFYRLEGSTKPALHSFDSLLFMGEEESSGGRQWRLDALRAGNSAPLRSENDLVSLTNIDSFAFKTVLEDDEDGDALSRTRLTNGSAREKPSVFSPQDLDVTIDRILHKYPNKPYNRVTQRRRPLTLSPHGPEFVTKSGATRICVSALEQGQAGEHRCHVTVVLLDGHRLLIPCTTSTTAGRLYKVAVQYLDLMEPFYFGLAMLRQSEMLFVDEDTPVEKLLPTNEFPLSPPQLTLFFRFQFYARHLEHVRHRTTRRLLYLQLRRDILEGKLQLNRDLCLHMGALALQVEQGRMPEENADVLHASHYLCHHYVPRTILQQIGNEYARKKLTELYSHMSELSETDAEFNFIESAQKCQGYGTHFYTIFRDRKRSNAILLGVNLRSVEVYEYAGGPLLHQFPWGNILKISFHKRRFSILPKTANSGSLKLSKISYWLSDYKKGKYLFNLCLKTHQMKLSIQKTYQKRPQLMEDDDQPSVDVLYQYDLYDQIAAEKISRVSSRHSMGAYVVRDAERETSPSAERRADEHDDATDTDEASPVLFHAGARDDDDDDGEEEDNSEHNYEVVDNDRSSVAVNPSVEDARAPHVATAHPTPSEEAHHDESNMPATDSAAAEEARHVDAGDEIEVFEHYLAKIDGTLGMKVTGGKNSTLKHIFIKSIIPGGAVDRDGQIQVGDRVLAVNDVSLEEMTHRDAVQTMIASGDVVKLRIQRTSQSAETFMVELNRGEQGLGLSFSGGVDCADPWIVVRRLYGGQPAAATGRIRVGDILVEANDMLLDGLSHEEVKQFLMSLQPPVRLVFRRLKFPPSPKMDGDAGIRTTDVLLNNEARHVFKPPPDFREPLRLASIASDDEEIDEKEEKRGEPSKGASSLAMNSLDSLAMETAQSGDIEMDRVTEESDSIRTPSLSSPNDDDDEKCWVSDAAEQRRGSLRKQSSGSMESPESAAESGPAAEQPLKFVVDLEKNARGSLGFTVSGGRDVDLPPQIKEILHDPAKANARLRVGDRLLEVNGQDLTRLSHLQLLQVLRGATGVVRLVLARAPEGEETKEDAQETKASSSVPHNVYMPQSDVVRVELVRSLDGSFGFNVNNTMIGVVIQSIKPGSSAAACLRLGDKILQVNGEPVIGMRASKVAVMLKKTEGTLHLSVARVGFLPQELQPDKKEKRRSLSLKMLHSISSKRENQPRSTMSSRSNSVTESNISGSQWSVASLGEMERRLKMETASVRSDSASNLSVASNASAADEDLLFPRLSDELIEGLQLLRLPGGTPIPKARVDRLIDDIKAKLSADTIVHEFKELKSGRPNDQFKVGRKAENRALNRFRNILPYDDNRVVLRAAIDENDYINASWIRMSLGRDSKIFIACQAPMENTIASMWQMVWEQNVRVIAMLTQEMENGKTKCDRYWPRTSQVPLHTGKIEIHLEQVKHLAITDAVLLQLRSGQQKRAVTLLVFNSWPPEPSLSPLSVLKLARLVEHINPTGRPVVVHCTAGIGRTGTYLAIEAIRMHLEQNMEFQITDIVENLRLQRHGLVQTKDQYITVYQALLENLELIRNAID